MKRFPSNFPLKVVDGLYLKNKFDQCTCEEEIEDEYKDAYKTVTPSIRTIKRRMPNSRAICDGVMEWNITYKGKMHTFYTLQEVKYKRSKSLLDQLAQALHYVYLLQKENSYYNIKAVILNSEEYFKVIYIDDIQAKLPGLYNLFSQTKLSPSAVYSDVKSYMALFENDVKNTAEVTKSTFRLNNFIKSIYKKCV